MERAELHSILGQKMNECWNAYMDRLLPLPPIQIIGKAAEIAAARTCYDELTESPGSYPENLLEHLVGFDDPLEVLRERWMDEHCGDQSIDVEHALWSLWDYGPHPDQAPGMDGIS